MLRKALNLSDKYRDSVTNGSVESAVRFPVYARQLYDKERTSDTRSGE